jgi:hypothetical protein
VAARNHPHICHLYDVGPDYPVMEFVEGEPLRGHCLLIRRSNMQARSSTHSMPRIVRESRIAT